MVFCIKNHGIQVSDVNAPRPRLNPERNFQILFIYFFFETGLINISSIQWLFLSSNSF
jgi:hypothetical protein